MKMNFYYRCICCALFLWSFVGHRATAQGNFHLVPGTEGTNYIPEMKAINGYVYYGNVRTDGTGINLFENPSYNFSSFTATQGGLYFVAYDSKINKSHLRKTSGKFGASVIISQDLVSISNLIEINGLLYFIADDGVNGLEVWKTDGTAAGTAMIKDIGKSGNVMGPQNFTACNGALYFTMDDGVNGEEIWKTDGTIGGTMMVKDVYPGPNTFAPGNFAVLNNELYFSALSPSYGVELWKTNGTELGTVLVKDIVPGKDSSGPSLMIAVGDAVFFTSYDVTAGYTLWKTQGTEATTFMVKDINLQSAPNDNSSIGNLTSVNGTLYFSGNDGIHGIELWKSDGTEAGTTMVKDLSDGAGNESGLEKLFSYKDHLFFNSLGQLWKSDGDFCNTVQVTSLDGVSLVSYTPTVGLGDKLFFLASTTAGKGLYYYDFSTGGPKGICSQDITAADIQPKKYGDAPFSVTGTATSGLPVTFTSSNLSVATVNGSTVTITGAGEATITATQEGNANYAPVSVHKMLVVEKADQTITLDPLPKIKYGDEPFEIKGTTSSGLAAVFTSSDPSVATIDANVVTVVGAGEVTFTATQAGDANYNPATAQLLVVIEKADQTVTFDDLIPSKTYGDDAFTIAATASTGLPVVFTSSNPNVVTINGNTVTIVGGGEVTITATQSGDTNYASASAQQVIVIEKKSQTISFDALPNRIFGEAPFSVTATSSSGLPVSFSSADNTIATIFNNKIMLQGSGDVVITATQEGDNRYLAAAPVTQTLSIKLVTAVEPISPNKVSVYPNPVADYLTLQGFSSEESVKVQLHRMDGKVVDTQDFSGRTDYQLDMNSLTPGIYLITITSPKGQTSERIIKK